MKTAKNIFDKRQLKFYIMVQLFKSKGNLYLDQMLQTTLNNLIFQSSYILLNKIQYCGGIKIASAWVDTNSHYTAE